MHGDPLGLDYRACIHGDWDRAFGHKWGEISKEYTL